VTQYVQSKLRDDGDYDAAGDGDGRHPAVGRAECPSHPPQLTNHPASTPMAPPPPQRHRAKLLLTKALTRAATRYDKLATTTARRSPPRHNHLEHSFVRHALVASRVIRQESHAFPSVDRALLSHS
jgi:hypothetical protein